MNSRPFGSDWNPEVLPAGKAGPPACHPKPAEATAKAGEGWAFDYYPVPGGMAVWVLDAAGQAHRVVDRWTPVFHAAGRLPPRAFRGLPVDLAIVERLEFYSGRPRRVTAVRVMDPALFRRAAAIARRIVGPERLFDVDIPLAQLYGYDRGIYPLARVDADLRPLESPWQTDYALPPMRVMEIGFEGVRVNPAHGRRRAALEVRLDGVTEVIDEPAALAELLKRHDPDVLATRWGDETLLPMLERAGLVFHRDLEAAPQIRARRSYVSYGKIARTGGTRPLLGRWHLDLENSFLIREAGIDGLIDLARLTKIPVQQLTRCTVGTGITSMQLDVAYRDGVLIPCEKRQTEGFKTAEQLLVADKGGLTYVPPIGYFKNVGELDFASMYPTIMARYNVSPETVNCACCVGDPVPEIGHRLCTRRRGLVPRVLEPILERRARYKVLRDASSGVTREMYDRRQTALKWVLVCCFGYLGFRNARFGKIEAHESVTAFSREILLRAKEIAEARGFRMLHAIVDSLWVDKPARELADEISRETGLPISYEGTYRWIGFLPSRMNRRLAVYNRYCGVFENGKLKVRGIEMRRHDAPRIVRRLQQEILDHLAGGDPHERARTAGRIVEEHVGRLRDGRVSPADLAIARTLTRAPHEYRQNNLTAIVARRLAACGIEITPGERVAYIVVDDRSRVPDQRAVPLALATESWEYDARYYEKMLRDAAETILGPLEEKEASTPFMGRTVAPDGFAFPPTRNPPR